MQKQFSLNSFVNPIAQVGLILVTSLILYSASAHFFSKFHISDPAPILKQSSIVNLVKIKTGFFVNHFPTFDLVKNSFLATGVVWFEFDKGAVDLTTLEHSVFSKSETKQQAILRGSAEPIIRENGNKTFVQYHVQVKFMSNLDHRLFPFDSHRLYLTLNNRHLEEGKFELVSDKDSFVVSKNIKIHGWSRINKHVQSGYVSKQISADKTIEYPRVVYSVDFVRSSAKDILLLVFPLLIALFMSMFAFSYDHDIYKTSILSTGTATVGAMVGYRFVISNASPHVPYFMLIDHLFNIFLILAFFIFLINVFNLFKNKRGLLVLVAHAILIGSWCGLLYLWA